ncbi:hypothetical protein J31TS4_14570 [Paenibacillus sp. J31TS4]|uniref:formylglycine-generating enzyme family protein n=1 Tax=Paenibacillus sp. J31TS4 TaxID=2807195 RepID=UPI001B23E92D|nr:SUMF1/EgtB/PvdO family nonheme iron enzyme [Paenibacillus sp. J31TS4]GIP38177.1 hypothetical protein J31TS4_14570 [Paenibacillus sp. J31TS4]
MSREQGSDAYPMIRIPPGKVALRDDRKKTSWTAEVEPFLLAAVPVTRELYVSVPPHSGGLGTASRVPVTEVSWQEAVAFCNQLSRYEGLEECYAVSEDGETVHWNMDADGYRLPTEAEWQYACQAGAGGYRYGGLEEIAWYRENSGGYAHEAGAKRPNAWGLYDMLGNVWEWCWDQYDEQEYGSYRIFRGGSWAEEARGCGATCRRRSHPTFRIEDLGFRLARSL